MDGCCLYIEAIAELRSHVEMKMSVSLITFLGKVLFNLSLRI
jgi:hypothetical protein